jgi:hypothetical protein
MQNTNTNQKHKDKPKIQTRNTNQKHKDKPKIQTRNTNQKHKDKLKIQNTNTNQKYKHKPKIQTRNKRIAGANSAGDDRIFRNEMTENTNMTVYLYKRKTLKNE